jgi:phosphotriesterase-related protein
MSAPTADPSPVLVNTVRGTIPVDELGVTLTHEHLICDWAQRADEPEGAEERELWFAPVTASINWLLVEKPGCCKDDLALHDPDGIIDELEHFTAAGGQTVVDCTTSEIGRDPIGLQTISTRSGLNVVMGSGWYLHPYHDPDKVEARADELCEELVAEFTDGVANTGVKPGIIGEIGVSPKFTCAEKTRLRAACRAQRQVGVPLVIHLPGWQRRALEVLDIVLDDEGVAAEAVVLCHMDPSGEDPGYQRAVAERGVWLEFDMIGMLYWFAGEGQSPAPHQTADAIAGLVRDGHQRILLSHDFGSKSRWTQFGGSGVGYVPRLFLPRLERHGVPASVVAEMMTSNPRRLFTESHNAIGV